LKTVKKVRLLGTVDGRGPNLNKLWTKNTKSLLETEERHKKTWGICGGEKKVRVEKKSKNKGMVEKNNIGEGKES